MSACPAFARERSPRGGARGAVAIRCRGATGSLRLRGRANPRAEWSPTGGKTGFTHRDRPKACRKLARTGPGGALNPPARSGRLCGCRQRMRVAAPALSCHIRVARKAMRERPPVQEPGAPTEQPPRKLSGKRTARREHSGERRDPTPAEGDVRVLPRAHPRRAVHSGSISQAPVTEGDARGRALPCSWCNPRITRSRS